MHSRRRAPEHRFELRLRGARPVPEVPKVPSPLMPWEPKSPGVEVGSERKRVFSDGRSLPDDDDPLTDDDPLFQALARLSDVLWPVEKAKAKRK